MKGFRIKSGIFFLIVIALVNFSRGVAQTTRDVEIDKSNGFSVTAIIMDNGNKQNTNIPMPLFSLKIDNEKYFSGDAKVIKEGEVFRYQFGSIVQGSLEPVPGFKQGWKIVYWVYYQYIILLP